MNRTKRKIFETSMKLFAEKGYDATSIEDITSEVGVAKGTLYYHFSSKEEIFNFLIDEGMNLLRNSINIKVDSQRKYIDKIRAIVLIQIKIIVKYENFMTIVLSEIWGNSARSKTCKKYLEEYLQIVREIVEKGIEKKEIKPYKAEIIVSEIFGLACTSLLQKKNGEVKIDKLFKELDRTYIQNLKIEEK